MPDSRSDPSAEPFTVRTLVATVLLAVFCIFIWWLIESRSSPPPPPINTFPTAGTAQP